MIFRNSNCLLWYCVFGIVCIVYCLLVLGIVCYGIVCIVWYCVYWVYGIVCIGYLVLCVLGIVYLVLGIMYLVLCVLCIWYCVYWVLGIWYWVLGGIGWYCVFSVTLNLSYEPAYGSKKIYSECHFGLNKVIPI